MGFAEAWINVQVLVQVVFDMPWYYDTKNDSLVVNPKFRLKLFSRMKKMPTWTLFNLTAFIALVVSATRLFLVLLAINTETETHKQFEEIVLHWVVFSTTLLAQVTTYSVQPSLITICNDILRKAGVCNVGYPTKDRLPDQGELMGYGLIGLFLCFPVVAAASPFLINNDPINRYLNAYIPNNFRHMLAAFLYGIFTFVGANVLVIFLIIVLACCNIQEKLAEQNWLETKSVFFTNRQDDTDKTVMQWAKHFL